MKKILVLSILLALGTSVYADQYVNGYFRKNGTYVNGYYRTNANSTTYDNYSTRGNVNPYTGQRGYRDPNYVAPVNGPANYYKHKTRYGY